jgi:hypothetical protein
LSKTIVDPSEADIQAAAEFDSKVTNFGMVTEDSFEQIIALRTEYDEMSYTRKACVTKYTQFKEIERSFYQTFALSQEVKENVLLLNDCYNMISSTTRGTVSQSSVCGLDIKWTDTTTNQLVGVNKAYALDGLTVDFGGLDFSSKNKVLGFVMSSLARDKYTTGQSLLLQIDFSSGSVYVGDGTAERLLGDADALRFENVINRPVRLKLVKTENEYEVIITVYGEDSVTFAIPQEAIESATNLTDETKVFVSVSPWAKNTCGEMNLYSISGKLRYANN